MDEGPTTWYPEDNHPPKKLTCPPKEGTILESNSSSNHQFPGDKLVLRGVGSWIRESIAEKASFWINKKRIPLLFVTFCLFGWEQMNLGCVQGLRGVFFLVRCSFTKLIGLPGINFRWSMCPPLKALHHPSGICHWDLIGGFHWQDSLEFLWPQLWLGTWSFGDLYVYIYIYLDIIDL